MSLDLGVDLTIKYFHAKSDLVGIRINITYIYIYICLVGWVFANGSGDQGSIPGRVIPDLKKSTWYLLAWHLFA